MEIFGIIILAILYLIVLILNILIFIHIKKEKRWNCIISYYKEKIDN